LRYNTQFVYKRQRREEKRKDGREKIKKSEGKQEREREREKDKRDLLERETRERERETDTRDMAMHAAKAILTSIPAGQRPCRPVRTVDVRR